MGEGLLERLLDRVRRADLDDPERGAQVRGLDEHRQPEAADFLGPSRASGVDAPRARRRAPAARDDRHQLLEQHLVQATAEAVTPAPTYATSSVSTGPAPCRPHQTGRGARGTTTSTPSRPSPGVTRSVCPSRRHTPSRPISIDRLVPRADEPVTHRRPRGSDTSCSDERPPASTATTATRRGLKSMVAGGAAHSGVGVAGAGGVVVVVVAGGVAVVVVVARLRRQVPTPIVTVEPLRARAPPLGVCSRTTPTWACSVVASRLRLDLEAGVTAAPSPPPPARPLRRSGRRLPWAPARWSSRPALPYARSRRRRGTARRRYPEPECWRRAWIRCRARVRRPSRVASAASSVWPTTSGMRTGAGPLETSSVTRWPSWTSVSAGGSVPITRPASTVFEGSLLVVVFRPALCSLDSALATVKPATFVSDELAGPGRDDDVHVRALLGLAAGSG